MRPSRLGGFAAAAVCAMVAGCAASMNVSSYVERGVDLTRYHSYAWAPAGDFSTGDPRLDNNPFFQSRVRADVEGALARRGFAKAASGEPDLLVHYHASISQGVDANSADRQYGYCTSESDDCRPFVYDAGTLVVDLVDRRTNRVIWRGWAEGSVDGMIDNQDWMEQKIDDAVTRIMERLPRGLS